MELRKLRYFVRVAEDGSLTRAAGILRVAQPALSRQMRLLEEELGLKLFARTSRGMQLSDAGAQLYAAVAAPLRELELALDNARAASDSPAGTLVIGLPPGLSELLGLAIADMLERDFPGVAVRLVEGPTGSLVDWLNRGAVDLAFLEEISRDNRLEDRLLLEAGLWLVGPAASRLAARSEVTLAEAAGLPLILPSHHMGIRGAIDDAAAQARLVLDTRLYADTPQLLRGLVAAGKGYGLLPGAYCRADIAAGRLAGCPIAEPCPAIGIHLTVRRRGRLNPDRMTAIEAGLAMLAIHHLSPREA